MERCPAGTSPTDLRDLDVTELLGRRQVDTGVEAICGYLAGKRVLVTGAGGSIGSELCRQIRRLEPAELYLLDHDESALHAVELSIYRCARLNSPNVILADIREPATVQAIFLVLDMGEPVRIVDVARRLMQIAGRFTPIVYTGLRPGEKLHEELFGWDERDERDERPLHPSISHVNVPPLSPVEMDTIVIRKGSVAAMRECGNNYQSAIDPSCRRTA